MRVNLECTSARGCGSLHYSRNHMRIHVMLRTVTIRTEADTDGRIGEFQPPRLQRLTNCLCM
eukprot:COSAG01_NODE_1552_length_9933_cov_13.631483_2_plen_62_part_00